MAKTLGGWKRIHTSAVSGELAHYKEVINYGIGNVVHCICSEFGDAIADAAANVMTPNPPPGVNFDVLFIQNNTMSTASDLNLQGAETSGGTFSSLKDDVTTGAAHSGSTSYNGQYVQQAGATPSGGRMPVMRFYEESDGLHSTSIGAEQTSEIHITWIIP